MDWIDQLEQVLAVAAAMAFLGLFVILIGMVLQDFGRLALAGGGVRGWEGDDGDCGARSHRKPKPPFLSGGAAAPAPEIEP